MRSLVYGVMMIVMFAATSLFLLSSSGASATTSGSRTIKIFLDDSGQLPYEENAAAGKLSFFNIHVLGQLLQVTDSLAVEPALLEKAEFDFKNKEYILKLRPGTKFHNSRTANSKDLEFSLLRGFFSKNQSFYRNYLGNIDGIEDIKIGKFRSGSVRGVRIIDDLTIGVKLSKPNPSFVQSLANPYFSLVAMEALDETYLKWKNVPVGAGDYRVDANSSTKGITRIMKVNADLPGPESADLFTQDISSSYDISILPTDKIENKLAAMPVLPGLTQTLFLSRLNVLSSNENFRKALIHGLNRQKISAFLPGSAPSWEMLPSHFWGRSGERQLFNVELAKRFADKIPLELREKKWVLHLFNGQKEPPPYVSELISQINGLGFRFRYETTTEKFRSLESATEIPLYLAGRVTDYIDPLIMFASFLPTGHDPYQTFKSDPEFEAGYKKAAESITLDSRVETVKELSHLLSDKIVCVPILERRLPAYYNSKNISHVKMWGSLGGFKLQDLELAK
jgi:ABC-type transport system substrate-binding protein